MRREIIKILVKVERHRITIGEAVEILDLLRGPVNDREKRVLETLAIRELTVREALREFLKEDAA